MKKLFIFILLVISSVLHALPLQVDSTGAITGPVTSAQFTARISSALTSADAVTFTGDSMTLGNALPAGQSYPEALHLLSNFSAVTSWSNVAVGGRSITNLISAYAAEVYPRRPAGLGVTRSYLFLWTGTTNYASADLETNWTNISSYMTTAKADGFTLIVITIPRRTSPPSATGDYEAKRQILNDRMRLSDIPYMVIDADKIFTNGIENTDVSIDGTHLSYNSNKRLAQYINSIWPLGDPHSFGASPIFEKVSIGGTEPNACAALDISSTTKGVRLSPMTTAQRNAISSPVTGLTVFDTTLGALVSYVSSAWKAVVSGVGDEITFANFSLVTMSDNTRKAFLTVLGNFPAATPNIVHVSKSGDATNTRTLISPYNPWRPFAGPEAAKAAASSGDTIIVEPGSYTVTTTLAKDGVNWRGFVGTVINSTTPGLALFDDGGVNMQFSVSGFGELDSLGAGGAICKITNGGSTVGFDQILFANGDKGYWCNGGNVVGEIGGVIANNYEAILTDGGGYTDLFAHSAVTYGSTAAISCPDGTQYVKSFIVSSDGGDGVSCGASGYQLFTGEYVHGDNAAFSNAGGTQYGTGELTTGSTYSVSNSGGESYITTQLASGSVSTLSGTGEIKLTAQEINGQILGGSNASSVIDVTCPDHHSAAATGVEVDAGKVFLTGTFKSTGTAGVAVNLAGTSSKLILRDAVLVSDSAASYSISKTTGSPTIKVYQAVGNKAVQAGITQQVGTVLVDSNVE